MYKKETPRLTNTKSPVATSENDSAEVSIDRITQNDIYVNSYDTYAIEKNSSVNESHSVLTPFSEELMDEKKTLLKGRAELKTTQACRQQTMSLQILYPKIATKSTFCCCIKKTETDVMGNSILEENQVSTSLLPISNISLQHLFKNIKPKDAESGKLIINNKNKANEHLSRIGIQPSERDKIINLAKDSVPQMTDEVN